MASYSIHSGNPKIYVNLPSGADIAVDDSTAGQIKITIPKGTYMSLGSGEYGFNYCAFVQIEVTKSNGDIETIPSLSSAFIEKLTKQSAAAADNAISTFKNVLADYVFLFRVGEDTQSGWSSNPTLQANRTKTFTIDPDAISYKVYLCGVTVNTATWNDVPNYGSNSLRYSSYSWVTTDRNTDTQNSSSDPGGGGNACPCEEHASKVDSDTLWSSIKKGSVSITDNGNNTVTVKGKNGEEGTKNAITDATLSVKLSDGTSLSLATNGTIDSLLKTTSKDNFEYIYKLPSSLSSTTTTVTVSAVLTNTATYGSSKKATTSKIINYYVKPNPPTSLWYESNNEDSRDSKYTTADTNGVIHPLMPRINKNLTWKWLGATSGNSNSKITGYRIFIYKNSISSGTSGTSMLLKEPKSTQDSTITNISAINTGTRGHEIETEATTNLNFTFNPKIEGFVSKDVCYCRVFSATTWGDGSIHYSDDDLQLSCELRNSAVIWIKTAKDTWTEGVPYVKTSDGWKEAEGVYIKTSDTEWSESQ